MKPQIEISITKLTSQVNDGMRKKEISEYYNIPEFQVGKMLKQAGLKIRKIHEPAFVLISDNGPVILGEFGTQHLNYIKDAITSQEHLIKEPLEMESFIETIKKEESSYDFTQQEINQTFVEDEIVERATTSDVLEFIDKKNW